MLSFTKVTRRSWAVLGFSAAFAATGLAVHAEAPPQSPLEGTLICRQASAAEQATAKMVSSSTALVCRPIAVAMRGGDGSLHIIGDTHARAQAGPDFSKAVTPAQMREACERWLETFFHIDHTP
jgi:hypothetical protein